MKLGFVVLYVQSAEDSINFWTEHFGMQVQNSVSVGDFLIASVAQSESDVALQLVPLAMMKENPDNLDLATPSICFYVSNLESEHKRLISNGVQVSEIMQRGPQYSFAFSDNEHRWFAVMERPQ